MKTKKVTRMLALLLTSVMMFTACGEKQVGETGNKASQSKVSDSREVSDSTVEESTEAASEYPEYLNVDSAYPIVKDEYAGKVKPTVCIVMDDSARPWDELWLSKYLEQKYNLEFDVEVITLSALAERKSLMLNSGELPDIMINFWFGTTDFVQYGQEEGLFLPLDEYMDETLTPNILKYFEDPVLKANCSTPDGHVYTLPFVSDGAEDGGFYDRFFIDTELLEQVDMAMPKTLDEFVDAMYAIKEADPTGVGSENMYPFGGGMDVCPMGDYLLQALGFMTDDPYGLRVCLRDGEVTIPAYDMDVYKEYLKIMNRFYEDDIIVPNYFTIESTEVNAMLVEGKTALYDNDVTYGGVPQSEAPTWESLIPLTSDWQEKPESRKPSNIGYFGNFVISADTEYPELCLRFADTYFNNETDISAYLWLGVPADSEYALDENGNPDGFCHYSWIEESGAIDWGIPEGYDLWSYAVESWNGFMPNFGAYGTLEANKAKYLDAFGVTYEYEGGEYLLDGSWNYKYSIDKNLKPYAVDTYPAYIYFDLDTNQRVTDLSTVINSYAKEQIALFITGRRSLDETDAFVEELKAMGIEELLQIHADAYNVYLSNQK